MPDDELDVLVFCSDPIAFRSGSAEILGRFERGEGRLVMELAHIEGGGEGVLPALYALLIATPRAAGSGRWSGASMRSPAQGPTPGSERSSSGEASR